MSARDLFPPDMDAQRDAFGQAMSWLFDELIAQRAEEPVAFLAQLGPRPPQIRCHPTRITTPAACAADHVAQRIWPTVGPTARRGRQRRRSQLIVGVMSGAADAETSPPFCDGTVLEHIRPTRDVSVVRLKMDQPLAYHPGPVRDRAGAAVAAPVALPEPGDPRRPRRRHRVPRPLGHRRHGQHRDRRRDPAGRPLAAVQPARRDADRPRRRRRADGGGQHRAGAAADADHGPDPVRARTRGCTCSSAPAIPASSTTCARCGRSRRPTRGCR